MNAPVRIVTQLDPKLAFLARAAARFELVQAGEMDVDEAIAGLRCPHCVDELVGRWEHNFPHRPLSKPKPRQHAAHSSLDALVYELRTRGLSQLQNPNCIRRLSDLSAEQTKKLIENLLQLRPKYPAITDDLISKLGDCL
jgi:hypothetical protein